MRYTAQSGKWISTTCCACLAKSIVLMSKGFALIVPSLHHNLAGHFRANGAKVRITSRLAEGERELLIRVAYLGLERTFRADHRVGNVVSIGPCHGSPYRHCQSSGP